MPNRPAQGVASSAFGPVSFAYCSTCLEAGAEHLVEQRLGFKLAKNSAAGYDAVGSDG